MNYYFNCYCCKQEMSVIRRDSETDLCAYKCTNEKCYDLHGSTYTTCRIFYHPKSKSISGYVLCFKYEDEWYRLLSDSKNKSTFLFKLKPKSNDSNEKSEMDEIITVEKYYPLSIEEDWYKRVVQIYHNLKALAVFS